MIQALRSKVLSLNARYRPSGEGSRNEIAHRPSVFEQPAVGGERFCDPRLRVVEVVEIAAEARRVRLDQYRGTAREIRIEGPVLGEQACSCLSACFRRPLYLGVSSGSGIVASHDRRG